jgi:hypothetical protein
LTIHFTMPFRLSGATYPPTSLDPISVFFDTTMPGGTALISGTLRDPIPSSRFDDFVAVRTEVILEYEQTISELRKQLLHYKQLVSQLIAPTNPREDYEQPFAVVPIDPASVRVINSIVQARIPSSATFRDFDEGEL